MGGSRALGEKTPALDVALLTRPNDKVLKHKVFGWAAHLSKSNAGVPSLAQGGRKSAVEQRAKAGSIEASSAGDDRKSAAYRSFRPSGVWSKVSDKLTQW